jgi:hypothetical protein
LPIYNAKIKRARGLSLQTLVDSLSPFSSPKPVQELFSQQYRPRLVLDVIMGMNWMNKMGVVIDVESRTIYLKEPIGEGTFQVVLPLRIDLGSTTCAVQTTLLAKIPVVYEFPDVFPDELPGLSPDRDAEFAIELIPRTPPISRRPYRIPPNELADLKKQL